MSLADEIEEAEIPEFPKLEWKHSTVGCGDHLDRWEERRAILIAQRGYRLEQLRLVRFLKSKGVPHLSNIDRMERPVDALNAKIEECNRMIEALGGKKPLKAKDIKKLVG